MSELIQNKQERLESFYTFSLRMIAGENGKMLYEDYRYLIETVNPWEAMMVLDHLLTEGIPVATVKAWTGKLLNLFYKSLNDFSYDKPAEGHFLYYLMLENRAAEAIMAEMKIILKAFPKEDDPEYTSALTGLQKLVIGLKDYELHYVKKENILFPVIEQTFPHYRCLQLMWSFHDDFRRLVKTIDAILVNENPSRILLINELGKLFFVVLPIIFREEKIVFPVALRAIPAEAWAEMLAQSNDIGWSYGVQEIIREEAREAHGESNEPGLITYYDESNINDITIGEITGKVNLGTGTLTPEQLILLLNNIPVDITFVDENDEVRYFSGGTHRIFPRSNAIIGRKVQNCHPPESVGTVNEIVAAFRQGRKDHADFWIQMKGRFIHIRYFALRDETGTYRGTVEVSQDVSEIRALEGQRRLLNWEG